MISKINICNIALAHLGQGPISSLNQADERAKRISLLYEPVRDEVLRAHNWGFAGTKEKLKLARYDQPNGEFLYHYPANALFIREVFVPGQHPLCFHERYDTQVAGRVLAVKAADVWVYYTRRVADETQFDGSFVKAFALALAQDLAITLTGDSALAEQIFQKYTFSLDEARRSNMTENFQLANSVDCFSEVR